MKTVDREGAVPIYLQVKQQVRDAILNGTLTDRVPSERELARRYGIAQMTARRALQDLVDEGILYREVGRGTFVCKPGTTPRRTHNIGFALHPVVADGVLNPYFSRVLRGAEQMARKHGYGIVFTSAIGELVEATHVGTPPSPGRKVDGILAVAIDDEEAVRRCARLVPTVVLDNVFEGLTCVVADNVGGARQATSHLLALGHRRVAHLAGHQGSAVGRERQAGYRRAHEDHGVAVDEALVLCVGFDFEAGSAGAERLASLPAPPTAIVCVNDAVALGAMKCLKERGLEIPGDISLVGFDDIEAASLVDPPLTTVRVPQEAIGALATELLLGAVGQSGPAARPVRRAVGVELVERASCRPV